MRAPDGSALTGATYFQKYANDAAAVLDIFTPHTLVYFVGAPISRGAERAGDRSALTLHALYAALAQSHPYGRYTDAGAAVLAGGRWTATLPCLLTEPCTGGRDATGTPVNVVRAPDGVHFCPTDGPAVRGVTAACSVWASGSWRFGNAMAAPVIAELIHARNEQQSPAGRPQPRPPAWLRASTSATGANRSTHVGGAAPLDAPAWRDQRGR
jgi:hypothetical protein